MDTPTLIVTELPELSDESAGQILEFMYAFESAFASRYYTQLRRYYQLNGKPKPSESGEPTDDQYFFKFDEIPF